MASRKLKPREVEFLAVFNNAGSAGVISILPLGIGAPRICRGLLERGCIEAVPLPAELQNVRVFVGSARSCSTNPIQQYDSDGQVRGYGWFRISEAGRAAYATHLLTA